MGKSTVNTGLPISPETHNPELFKELIRLYNAIGLLAQAMDDYTNDGTVSQALTDLQNKTEFSTMKVDGAFGCNGTTPQTALVLPANGTDLNTTMALVNKIKVALIANGICV